MPDVVISAEHLSKKYCRSLKRGMLYTAADVARDTLGIRSRSDRLRPDEFWSLDDVSFEVERGECLGLVGSNGAGKSTLLKILNGIIRPDRGSVRVRGRVGALIEVGAGFHPMLSGRENIYLNGSILGMSRREIDRKLDAIVAFSGLDGAALDMPVKCYSSGMFVRLGFSVAVHTEPEILLVDEVLAVGDIRFMGQCRRKIEELRRNGTSVLFVSHNLPMVDEVCDRGLLLRRGRVVLHDEIRRVTGTYRRMVLEEAQAEGAERDAAALPSLRFLHGDLLDETGRPAERFRCGETAVLRLGIAAGEEVSAGVLSLWLVRTEDDQVAGIAYMEVGQELPPLRTGDVTLRFRVQALPGEYRLGVTFSTDGRVGLVDQLMPCAFRVEAPERRCPSLGVYLLDVRAEVRPESEGVQRVPALAGARGEGA